MSIHTSDLPKNTEVLISKVHYNVTVRSTRSDIDGILQTSGNDEYIGDSQDGYIIDNNTFYQNMIILNGHSNLLLDGLNKYFDMKYLDEERIMNDAEIYAQELQVIYDLYIKGPSDTKYHKASVISESLIYLCQPEMLDTTN